MRPSSFHPFASDDIAKPRGVVCGTKMPVLKHNLMPPLCMHQPPSKHGAVREIEVMIKNLGVARSGPRDVVNWILVHCLCIICMAETC